MHRGIAADGDHLYPAFPYPYFDKISRADSDAIFAYLRSLPPVRQPPRKNKLIFPTNIRWLMTFWDWLFVPQSEFKHDPSKSVAWNRGGEIVHGLAHCGGCHTPKNFFFADESGQLLQGATIDGWHAPNLTGSTRTGLGRWTDSDIVQYLKTGKNRFGWVVGSMRAVVTDSSSKWTDADRHAVAFYLKGLPAAPEAQPKAPQAKAMQDGKAVFVAQCSACHSARNAQYPSLATNSVVGAADPTTLLRVILKGSQSAATAGQPRDFSMPAFAVLTNKKLAHLATYLRDSWGNRAGPVSVSTVKQTRNMLKPRD
jgi:mono/diheme cytochrome c family protein